jgi:predicted RecB family nuclease
MLYDLVACPHRVTMDLLGNPAERDAVSPFVQLLWERGAAHEKAVVGGIGDPYLDLSSYEGPEKERLTLQAMDRGEPLIYSGRISSDDLLGEPDLLRQEGRDYVAGDIKSGAGEEGASHEHQGKPKVHYAVQLALYTDILEHLGRSAGRKPFVWDIHGAEIPYDLMAAKGKKNPRRLWDDYETCLSTARKIVNRTLETLPAYSTSICKNCVWYSTCIRKLEATNDLTLIPELGRSKRDAMMGRISSIRELASINEADFQGEGRIAGIGHSTLVKMQERAKLLNSEDPRPYLTAAINLPLEDKELFFDIEVDPWREFCYLHGFIERQNGDNETEQFVGFFADALTPEAEKQAFAQALQYIKESQPCAIYYYSKYERTIYRNLCKKYPDVCAPAQIEDIFDPAHSIDLYNDVVKKATEWPTRDFSIKTLAQYLGFKWKDPHPSGAASIEWFYRWSESGDPEVRERILKYNEDDCRATRVLLDGIKGLSIPHRTRT